MSGICGIYSFDMHPPSPEEIGLMNEALLFRGRDNVGVLCDGTIAMGSTLLRTTPQSLHEQFPMRDRGRGLILTADARIDNRKELMSLLELQEDVENPISDGVLILTAYCKWGEACVERLLGDFAFALWDSRERNLFCARDHFGIRPFCYYRNEGRFYFASEVSALIALPGIPRRLDENFLSEYLSKNCAEKQITGFKDILRLEPAHLLVVREGREMQARRYWRPDGEKELPPATDEEYIEGFREKLFTAVKRRLARVTPVASELSGGQDSSMVAAVAQKFLKEEGGTLKTFSHALPKGKVKTIDDMWRDAEHTDERPLVDLILPWCGFREHTYITKENSPGFIELIQRTLKYRGYPPLHHYGTATYPFNQSVSQSGCKVLLSGFGGDQCVTGFGNGYYAELYRNFRWKTILQEAKGLSDIHGNSVFRNIVSSFILEAHPSLRRFLYRLFKGISDQRELDLSLVAISPDFARRSGAFTRARQARENYSLGRAIPGGSFKGQQLLEIEWGFIPSTVEERSSGTLACGVECRFPLLDRELVEYVLALPAQMKVKKGWKRYCARKSMEGFLPPEVQWRKRKTGPATVPYGKDQIFKDIGKIKESIRAMRNDSFIMQYLDEKRLVGALELTERGEVWDGLPVDIVRHAIVVALFLETVER